MTAAGSLAAERDHLANLLEAVQRCAYFLHATSQRLPWPLDAGVLRLRQKDNGLFEVLSAFNERFAKLQDTLGASMRHAAMLMSEPSTPFLRVLSLFAKSGVIDSVEGWQLCRAARNLAAHDYETDYVRIAEHFNEFHGLQGVLISAAGRMLDLCAQALQITPATADFDADFALVRATHNGGQG